MDDMISLPRACVERGQAHIAKVLLLCQRARAVVHDLPCDTRPVALEEIVALDHLLRQMEAHLSLFQVEPGEVPPTGEETTP